MRNSERIALCSTKVTLNGKPAIITGYRTQFATVRTLDGTMRGEWAWETVKHIVDNGGHFKL